MRRGDENVHRNSVLVDVETGEMSLINGDIDKINLDYLSLFSQLQFRAEGYRYEFTRRSSRALSVLVRKSSQQLSARMLSSNMFTVSLAFLYVW